MTYPGQSFGDPGTAQRTATVTLNADVSGYANQMGQAAQQTNMLSASVDQLVGKLGHLHSWAGHKLISFGLRDFATLGVATADAATFEKQLSTLSATAAVTGQSMRGIKGGIESAFAKFPVSRGDIIALTESLTNLGVTGEAQISSLTRTFIKLGAATGESSVGLAQGLVQLSRLMGVTDAKQIGNMANSLLTVSKNAGVSATGVLSFAQAIAPMARQAGIGEAAVIGISTAFSKAGADGYVAANSFNSMLSDITQLSSTGSPQLAKYANLIGVTTDQFKKMDKTTAFTEIVDQLNKMGPKAVATLDQLGLSGVRTQRAFAALAQSGGLKDQIAQSIGAQGNQNNLDKGSQAAFNNLADALAHVRDEFTQLGTSIGTTFLKPLELVTNGVGTFAGALNGLMKPFSAVIGSAAAVAGGMGIVGGVALNAAGLIGAVALGRMVTRGTHVSSFRDAYATRGGLDDLNKRQTESLDRYTGGRMSFMQRSMYEAGLGAAKITGPMKDPLTKLSEDDRKTHELYTSRQMGIRQRVLYEEGIKHGGLAPDTPQATKAAPKFEASGAKLSEEDRAVRDAGVNYGRLPVAARLASPGTWMRLGVAAPFRAISALNAGQAGMLRESTRTAWDRLRYRDEQERPSISTRFNRMVAETANKPMMDVVGGEGVRMVRGVGDLSNAYVNAGASQVGPMAGRLLRYGGPRLLTSMVAGFSGVPLAGSIANQIRTSGPDVSLGQSARNVSDAGLRLGAALRHPIKGFQELSRSSMATGRAVKDLGLKAAGAALGTGAGIAGSGIAAASRGLWAGTKQLGRAAFSLPGMLAISGITYASHRFSEQESAGNVDKFLNPIQKYNDLLGTTTTNLASFNRTLMEAGKSGTAMATSYSAAAKVTTEDVNNKPAKPTVGAFTDLFKHPGKGRKSDALVEALGLMPVSDPKQLQSIKEDMLSAGFEQGDVQEALDTYMNRGGPSQSSGLRLNPKDLAGMGQKILTTEGGGMFKRSKSTSGGHELGVALSGIDSQRSTDDQLHGAQFARQSALQGYVSLLTPLVKDYVAGSGEDSVRKAFEDGIKQIGGGGVNWDKVMPKGGNIKGWTQKNYEQLVVKALQSSDEGKNYLKGLKTTDVTKMPDVIANLAKQVDPNSFNGLLRSRGGDLGKFAATNDEVQGAIGIQQSSPGHINASVQLLLDKAVKLGGGLEGAVGELSKFQGAIGDSSSALYQQATAAQALAIQQESYKQPFETRGQRFGQAVTAYNQATRAYHDTPVDQRTDEQYQLVQTTKASYESSLADQQGYLQQMYQQAQAFGVQMKRAGEDEITQEKRAKRNFHTQMGQMDFDYHRQQRRAQDDFNLQTRRAEADHATELTNQAATAAQSIYDPYARIQSKYVIDAGTLSQNLGDQNAALAKQRAELRKAKKMGLSEQSIQELNLADPNNAQQLNELVDNSLTPGMAKKINAQVGSRVSTTKKLTENPDNLAFQQSERDYKKQLQRSATDFHTQMSRAGEDYQTTVSRALLQQSVSMGDMTRDYQRTISRAGDDLTTAMTEVTGNFGNMYAKTMEQIASSVEKFSPKAAKQMKKDLKSIIDENPWLMSGDASSYNGTPPNKPSTGPRRPGGTSTRAVALAEGGITVGPTLAWVSEWAPNASEAHIPLNDRGATFMSDVISKALLQKMHTSGRGAVPSGAGSSYQISEDHSTNFSGDMHISAANLGDLLRQLERKQRLHRLSSPSRNGR